MLVKQTTIESTIFKSRREMAYIPILVHQIARDSNPGYSESKFFLTKNFQFCFSSDFLTNFINKRHELMPNSMCCYSHDYN